MCSISHKVTALTHKQAFSSLLSSIGKTNQSSSQPGKPATTASTPAPAAKPQAVTISSKAVAGVKRKPEDQTAGPQAKVAKTEVKVPVKSSAQSNGQLPAAKSAGASAATAAPYRGTLKPTVPSNAAAQASKVASRAVPPPVRPTATAASMNATAPPKLGFTAMMQKAKAAQASAKGAVISTIKHKPVEKLTKRERRKMQENTKTKAGPNGEKLASNDRSRSGTPIDGKSGLSKKVLETGYKGTMNKKPVPPPVSYRGTMKKAGPGATVSKPAAKKGLPQDRFGGYADWDELDDAQEEPEDDYDSYETDDMEAGFDDVAGEEELALRSARKEDQEALAEEERHRREKEERRKKLAALNKSAAAAKKKY